MEERRMKPNKELVKKIVSFISTTSDPNPLLKKKTLLASLQDTIAAQFFAKVGPVGRIETVTQDRPGLQPLHVDRAGVVLLLQAKEGLLLGHVRLEHSWLKGELLTALSCLASGRSIELEVDTIWGRTEEEVLAMVHLLACCQSWRTRHLRFTGQMRQVVWEGLARAADRGTVGIVYVAYLASLQRGKIEDVRRVWECTEMDGRWEVYGERCMRSEGNPEENSWLSCLANPLLAKLSGWGKIERLMIEDLGY